MVKANHVDRISNVILCQRKGLALIVHNPLCSDHWSANATCFRTENLAIVLYMHPDAIAKAVINDV